MVLYNFCVNCAHVVSDVVVCDCGWIGGDVCCVRVVVEDGLFFEARSGCLECEMM